MTIHIATATVVKVSIGGAGANSVAAFVRRGEIVPGGVSEEQLERLVKQGFIEEIEIPEDEPEVVVFLQADVDAAVKAALDAKDAEIAEAAAAAKVPVPAAAAKVPASK